MTDNSIDVHDTKKHYVIMPEKCNNAISWSILTSKPIIIKDNDNFYVVSPTRMWTHELFIAMVSAQKWNYSPPYQVIKQLYDSSLKKGKVGEKFITEKYESPRSWWVYSNKEIKYNFLEWMVNTADDEILEQLDICNVKFEY